MARWCAEVKTSISGEKPVFDTFGKGTPQGYDYLTIWTDVSNFIADLPIEGNVNRVEVKFWYEPEE